MGMSAVAFEATQGAKKLAALSTLQARHAERRWPGLRGSFRLTSSIGPAYTGHRASRPTRIRDVEYRSARFCNIRL